MKKWTNLGITFCLVCSVYFLSCSEIPRYSDRVGDAIDTVNVDIIGYAPNFPFAPNLSVKEGDVWKHINTRLPLKGMYYLDEGFVGYGMADYIQCVPVQRPLHVVLAEIREVGKKEIPPQFSDRLGRGVVAEFRTVPLHGDIRFEFTYYHDSTCSDTARFEQEFHR